MNDLVYIVFEVLCFIPAIVLHEVGHGFMAYKLGDPTAKAAGRLSLNPLKHVDIFGTVLLPAIMILAGGPVFGYAKPVPYNPRYFKDKRKGDLLVGLAGPGVNLLLALLGSAIAWGVYAATGGVIYRGSVMNYVVIFLLYFVLINLVLMFFNLMPIPPLDGSSIFAFLLPEKYLPAYYRVQHYAMPVFLILVFILPQVLHVDPIGWYLRATAYGLLGVLFPF